MSNKYGSDEVFAHALSDLHSLPVRTKPASDTQLVQIHRRRVLLHPLCQPKTQCSQASPNILQSHTSRRLPTLLVSFDRAQISMSVHHHQITHRAEGGLRSVITVS